MMNTVMNCIQYTNHQYSISLSNDWNFNITFRQVPVLQWRGKKTVYSNNSHFHFVLNISSPSFAYGKKDKTQGKHTNTHTYTLTANPYHKETHSTSETSLSYSKSTTAKWVALYICEHNIPIYKTYNYYLVWCIIILETDILIYAICTG